MPKIIKYVIYDVVRNKFVIGYAVLLFIICMSFFGFEQDTSKGLVSILNINMIVVPLVSIIFSTIHFYNSYEFLELLSAQAISRKTIFFSQYFGVASTLSIAFLIGVGIPTFIFDGTEGGLTLVYTGVLLTIVFVSLAFLASVFTKDKAKGIGLALVLWFYFSLIYDGLVLSIFLMMSDYPMEKATLVFTALNPTDLARILVLMKLDVSALMGITGAVFQNFFSTITGLIFALFMLVLWIYMPINLASRIFNKKDL